MQTGTLLIIIGLMTLSLQAQAFYCAEVYESRIDEVTHPYTVPNQGPRGEPTVDHGHPNLISENTTAAILTSFGFRVRQNPHNDKDVEIREEFKWRQMAEELNPNKQPDFLINRKIFDHLMPSGRDAVHVARSILLKTDGRQTRRVTVDLINNEAFQMGYFSLRDLHYALSKKDNETLWEVIVIHGTMEAPRVSSVWPHIVEHSPIAP